MMSDEDKHVKLITLIISLQCWEAFGPWHSFGLHLTLTTHSNAANDQVHAQTAMSFSRCHWTPQQDSVLRHDTKTAQESPEERRPGLQILKVCIWGIICGSWSRTHLQNSPKPKAADVSPWPYSVGHVLPQVTCNEFGSVSQASNFYWTECLNSKKKLFICFFGRWMFRSVVDRRNDDRGSVVKAWSKSSRLAIFLISSWCWWEIW